MALLPHLPYGGWLPLTLAGGALVAFLVLTELATLPLVLLVFGVALLYPYRYQPLARHLLWLLILAFVLWLLHGAGLLLLPFAIAFLAGYLFDPLLTRLERWGIPRWASAASVVLAFLASLTALSILVFPTIFSQLDTLVRQLSTLYNAASSYLESGHFLRLLARYGIPPELVQQLLQRDVVPRLEQAFQTLMNSLLALLSGLSHILTHVVNLLLLPIVMFYLLKDFPQLRTLLVDILQQRAPRALSLLCQSSPIVRAYVGWIITVSALLGLLSGFLYVLFDIPYGVILGLLSGLLNPIPYFGILITLGVGAIAIVIAQPTNIARDLLLFALIINGLHFLNAYIVEPRILGKRIGVHPVLLIASLILFGSLFGFVGLLIAVPTTAVGVLLFNQWRHQVPATLASPPEVSHSS